MYGLLEEHSTEGLTEDAADSAESLERRREEEEALRAIFGDDAVAVADSRDALGAIRVTLEPGIWNAEATAMPRLTLACVRRRGYPRSGPWRWTCATRRTCRARPSASSGLRSRRRRRRRSARSLFTGCARPPWTRWKTWSAAPCRSPNAPSDARPTRRLRRTRARRGRARPRKGTSAKRWKRSARAAQRRCTRSRSRRRGGAPSCGVPRSPSSPAGAVLLTTSPRRRATNSAGRSSRGTRATSKNDASWGGAAAGRCARS